MVKTLPSNAGKVSSICGQGGKISHASWPKNQNIKQKQYCSKFNKDFQNGPLKKRNLKIRKLLNCAAVLSVFSVLKSKSKLLLHNNEKTLVHFHAPSHGYKLNS